MGAGNFFEFCGLQNAGKTISLSVRNCISQDLFIKKKNGHAKSLSMHFLSVLTDRVHQLQKGLRPFTGCVE